MYSIWNIDSELVAESVIVHYSNKYLHVFLSSLLFICVFLKCIQCFCEFFNKNTPSWPLAYVSQSPWLMLLCVYWIHICVYVCRYVYICKCMWKSEIDFGHVHFLLPHYLFISLTHLFWVYKNSKLGHNYIILAFLLFLQFFPHSPLNHSLPSLFATRVSMNLGCIKLAILVRQ